MNIESIVMWIVLGLIAGLIAKYLDPNPDKQGLVSTIILGILGSLLGGFLYSLLLGGEVGVGFDLTSLVVAVLGSLLVLWIGRRAGFRL